MPVKIIVCFLVGYLFGNMQTAFFIGKAHGIDIRRYGSGNAGTTNAMRTLGRNMAWMINKLNVTEDGHPQKEQPVWTNFIR